MKVYNVPKILFKMFRNGDQIWLFNMNIMYEITFCVFPFSYIFFVRQKRTGSLFYRQNMIYFSKQINLLWPKWLADTINIGFYHFLFMDNCGPCYGTFQNSSLYFSVPTLLIHLLSFCCQTKSDYLLYASFLVLYNSICWRWKTTLTQQSAHTC